MYEDRITINTIFSGFRAWGREMNKDVSPIESGLMPFVRMKKKVSFSISIVCMSNYVLG